MRFRKLSDRFFQFYFALTLIAFVLFIFLMNLPILQAAEPTPQALKKGAGTVAYETNHPDLKNPLRFKVSKPKPKEMTGEGQFLEYRGNRLTFLIRF